MERFTALAQIADRLDGLDQKAYRRRFAQPHRSEVREVEEDPHAVAHSSICAIEREAPELIRDLAAFRLEQDEVPNVLFAAQQALALASRLCEEALARYEGRYACDSA